MPSGPYLYRGTTSGWPGNSVLQAEAITCTTTDPLVATLFAVKCRNHHSAVILVARLVTYQERIGPANHFCQIESCVNLRVHPLEFARNAEVTLEVADSLAILREIGFTDLPERIRDKSALRDVLLDTYGLAERLNLEQLERFNFQLLGLSP